MPKFIYLVKNHYNQLEAHDIDSEQVIDKFKMGDVLKMQYTKPRNPQHHKKFFALINIVFASQDRYDTREDLLTEIKLRCGWYKEHLNVNGKIMYLPKSIAFDSMDQIEFDDFYNKAINVCLKYFINIDKNELIEKVIRF